MHGCAFVSARDTRSTLRKNENEKNERYGGERRNRLLSAFVLVSLSLGRFSVVAYFRFRAPPRCFANDLFTAAFSAVSRPAAAAAAPPLCEQEF